MQTRVEFGAKPATDVLDPGNKLVFSGAGSGVCRVVGSSTKDYSVAAGVTVGPFLRSTNVTVWATSGSFDVLEVAADDFDAVFQSPVSGAENKGFASASVSSLVIVRDHPYRQIVGGGGYDSMHQWFKDNGAYPYCLTVNTSDTDSNAVGYVNATTNLSWDEVRALQADGVEITNHCNRHIGSLVGMCTGYSLRYTGVNATATAYVTDAPRTLVLVDSGTTSFDLTNAAYDTLAELRTAVNAVSGWTMTLADELDGTERSADTLILPIASAKSAKASAALIAVGGGLYIRYKGSQYKTAMVRMFLNYVQIFGDGVEVAEYDTTNASYNTFTKLQALINVLESGDWECGVMNCGNNAPYCSGAEQASVNLPATTAFVDVHQRFGWLVGGMPVARMWDKVFARAKNVAAANGVTMLNSSDVGGANHAQVLLQMAKYSNLPRVTALNSGSCAPAAIPAYSAQALPNLGWDDNTGGNVPSNVAAQAIVDALVDSPGFVCSVYVHQVNPDGSSGKNFVPFDNTVAGAGYTNEAKWTNFLSKLKTAKAAGQVNVLTQQGFYASRERMAKPRNYVFNPRFKNSGEALAALGSIDVGWKVPGWRLSTQNISAMTIDADGTMTVTTSTASVSNYIQTLVYLEPGRTYHLGLSVETVAYTSGTGVSATLLPFAGGYEYLDLSQSTSSAAGFGDGINWIEYAGSAAGVHKYINAELTIPIPQRKRAYIRSRAWAGNTVDLSVNKYIRLNIDGAGNSVDIDCSAGAVSASAVYAWEVANAINSAIKADATYKLLPEFHGLARSDTNKRLILELPLATYGNGTDKTIRVVAGSTASAATTLFPGGASNLPIGAYSTSGRQGLLPYVFSVVFNAVGTFKVSSPVITEVASVV